MSGIAASARDGDRTETARAGAGEIAIRGVTKNYGAGKKEFRALEDIRLTIAANEFVTILGPSGCGKSTLLRIVAGLEDASEGEVAVDGATVVGPGADRGMVFQGYTLFPWLSVRENIEYGPKVALLDVWEKEKTTVLFITHDIDEAIFLSQRIVVMGAGPSRIVRGYEVSLPGERSPEVREHPAFLRLKRELTGLLKHKEEA